MKYLLPFILLAGVAFGSAVEDPPKPKPLVPPPQPAIILPTDPAPPPPPPPPVPSKPQALPKGELYVVRANVPCIVLSSPEGYVKVTKMSGPISVLAHFTDSQSWETRTFTDKLVFTVEAVKSGECQLLVIPEGASEKDVIRRTLEVDNPPPPPPTPIPPGPGPSPGPQPTPAPIPGPGTHVLIVFDSATQSELTPAQNAIIFGQTFRTALDTKTVSKADGYRIWPEGTATTNVEQIWKDAFARKRTSLPWIVISNGTTGYEGPLPATVDEAVALLSKYSGGK